MTKCKACGGAITQPPVGRRRVYCSKACRPVPQKIRHSKYTYSKYGLTVEEYRAMVDDRGNTCDACGLEPSGKGIAGKLHVDHNHTTGEVRGLLCTQCNTALGLLKDSEERILCLLSYQRG